MDEKITDQRLAELEAKWLNGTITPEEAAEYARWYNAGQDQPLYIPEDLAESREAHHDQMLSNVRAAIAREKNTGTSWRRRRIWGRAIAAAAVLIFAVGGVWYWLAQPGRPSQPEVVVHDALPGREGAILTLADGRKVVLDSMANGLIATQSQSSVLLQDGLLAYHAGNAAQAPGPVSLNTMSTPRGRQYRLILPDGTKVWLNAGSSLTYPTAFNGSDREVQLQGEAYFEVAHNAQQPFHVKVQAMEVRVLGTHFNIAAYPDEQQVRTTLLQGSVQVSGSGRQQQLAPGQQALYRPQAGSLTVKQADTAQAVAWKNGLFYFENDDLHTVMRVLSRWYDIEVVYKGKVPDRHFEGKVYRSYNLSEVLAVLKASDVHFTIAGKTLTVGP